VQCIGKLSFFAKNASQLDTSAWQFAFAGLLAVLPDCILRFPIHFEINCIAFLFLGLGGPSTEYHLLTKGVWTGK